MRPSSPPTVGPTSSPIPLPQRGDIINYAFLFSHERDAGMHEGKTRPVMVLAVVERRVTVMALTTKGDAVQAEHVPIPSNVAQAMKLPAGATSLVANQLNRFEWVGYDLRPRAAGQDHRFGRCPPGFFKSALESIGVGVVPVPRDT